MNDDNAIISAIKALLDTITDVSNVYEGIPNIPAAFPYIAIRPSSWSEVYADQRDTEIEAQYVIGVYTNITENTLTTQTALRSIVKQVREIMGNQANIELGGLVDYSNLTSGQYLFDQKDSSLYYCEIDYKVKKKYSRFT